MDDALLMRGGEPAQHLERVGDGPARGNFAAVQAILQRLALQQFAHYIMRAVLRAHVVDGEHVRMVEYACRARLLLEAAQGRGIAGEARGQNLDGDLAPDARVARAVDLAHAARAEESENFVGAEAGIRGERHGVSISWRRKESSRGSKPPKPSCRSLYR